MNEKGYLKGSHYYVAHIAKNVGHQDGRYVTWCGVHFKQVCTLRIVLKVVFVVLKLKRENSFFSQVGENLPCAMPETVTWSPMPGRLCVDYYAIRN